MKSLLEENKIVAIMRGIKVDQIVDVAQALYDGGIRVLECTFNQSAKDPCGELKEKLTILTQTFKDKMLIGAGTVMNVEQVNAAFEAGGKLIISPNVNEDVIKRTKELNMISMPGAMTPTEIAAAYEMGSDYVKVFPAGVLGAEYVKAIKAPLSNIPLFAVGGITPENMVEFKKVGVYGFGVGSPLLPKKVIEQKDYSKITELAKQYTSNQNK